MRLRILALWLVGLPMAAPLVAQTTAPAAVAAPALKLAAGIYTITSRDSTRQIPPDITFVLHQDGSFEVNIPGGEPILGVATQKDGVLNWAEPRCPETGQYLVRASGKGFYLEVKEDVCEGRKEQLAVVLFTPVPKP